MNDDVLSQPNTELSQDLEAIVHTEEPSKPKVVNLQATLVSKLTVNFDARSQAASSVPKYLPPLCGPEHSLDSLLFRRP